MKKVLISSIVLSASFVLGGSYVSASEQEAIYNLEDHNFIETFQLEEDGELIDVTIIDNPSFLRVADKTYTITKSKQKVWSISYKISVKNNKITSAHSSKFSAAQGNFSNTSLKKTSDTNVVATGIWNKNSIKSTITSQVSIKNKKLVTN